MARVWLLLGAVFGGTAVGLGAFAAHGLEPRFAAQYAGQTKRVAGREIPAAEKYLRDFKTGAEYQLTHSLALLAVGVLTVISVRPRRSLISAGTLFTAGMVIFSGSLYVLTLSGVPRWGAVTPIGGGLLLGGWLSLAIAAFGWPASTTATPSESTARG